MQKAAGLCIVIGKNRRDENDGLCEDDGHDTGAVHFQGQELTRTAKLAIANDLLGIVDGNLANPLDKQNTTQDDGKKDYGNSCCNAFKPFGDTTIFY